MNTSEPPRTEVHRLLGLAVEWGASDLHLAAGNPPVLRVHGDLVPIEGAEPLSADDLREGVREMLGDERFEELGRSLEFDGSTSLDTGHRIRINAYIEKGGPALALRVLPSEFFAIGALGLPERICDRIVRMHQGLVLVTGATGSGKTTTIASLVNEINRSRPVHIHTIEDPIEYIHASKRAYVTQRELGKDTGSFAEALRRSLRQDPDVVVIGEMRDVETMETALTLAETGHVTFATLHTSDAAQTISRVISAFPAARQPQIRIQMATTLAFIISQKLIPNAAGDGRSLAAEILVATPAVRALIRENKAHQLLMTMQTSYELGMRTMNQSLATLVGSGRVTRETALGYAENREELAELVASGDGARPVGALDRRRRNR
jgi:twitching motility protein PilT